MSAFNPRAWAKPLISVAATGIGAAVAGPLGGALGIWVGDALGGPTSKLVEKVFEKFGEKAAEKLADVGGDSLAEKLKPASAHLEHAYREALRQSLQKIGKQSDLQDFADWFAHWDRQLAAPDALDLSSIGDGVSQRNKDGAIWQILLSLDAQGKARGGLQIIEHQRSMPDALRAALATQLPETVRATFNALIVKPEYEAAWKQAERAFQDALKLAVADIGKTTRSIHRDTKELCKDSKAIRETLAPLVREPDAPLLGVSAGELKCWIVPRLRDKDAGFADAVAAEARRNGVPDFAWVSKVLAARLERLREARKTLERDVPPERWDIEWWLRHRDAGTPINETEQYGVKVEEWYRIAGYLLSLRQEYEIFTARSTLLALTISNSGRAPAQKVEAELVFPEGLSVDGIGHEPGSVPEPPEIPASFKGEIEEEFPADYLRPFVFYPGWPLPRLSWEDVAPARIEFFRQTKEADPRQVFSGSIALLEHGKSRVSRPLRLSFGFGPCHDLRIKYKLHASNQPSDTVGEIHIKVLEAAKPPKA